MLHCIQSFNSSCFDSFSFFPQTLISDSCISSKSFNPFRSPFLDKRRIKKEIPGESCYKISSNERSRQCNGRKKFFPVESGWNSDGATDSIKKRKIVEHIFLLRAKRDLSDDEEKDMLDFLYTSQYYMRGIIAISVVAICRDSGFAGKFSLGALQRYWVARDGIWEHQSCPLGSIANPNADDCTHGIYMRFQRREDLAKFYDSPFYLKILREHVIPYCHGSISVDYESEVEDDIMSIFRRGEDFEYGVEFVLLISVLGSALREVVDEALTALANLMEDFGSLIVQATQGSNFNCSDKEYTHGVVIRFPSLDALELFNGSSKYKDLWRQKLKPITGKTLAVHYAVDPVGAEIM